MPFLQQHLSVCITVDSDERADKEINDNQVKERSEDDCPDLVDSHHGTGVGLAHSEEENWKKGVAEVVEVLDILTPDAHANARESAEKGNDNDHVGDNLI